MVHICRSFLTSLLQPGVTGAALSLGSLLLPSGGRRESLIKGLTIRYCCERSHVRSRNRDPLVSFVPHLKAKVDSGSSSCVAPSRSAKAKLAELGYLKDSNAAAHSVDSDNSAQ